LKYIDEYRDKAKIHELSEAISRLSKKEISLMEVCGGHTFAIHKFGLPSLLPATIHLISGPGCPVCVSSQSFLDKAIAFSRLKNSIIVTYGDLIRVPGTRSSLEKEKAKGKDVRIVYSALEALEIAQSNQKKQVIFLGIGFETTAPASAALIIKAKELNLENLYLFSAHKIMPPVMEALVTEGIRIDGFIAPGHVSAITGSGIYTGLSYNHRLGVVISGFEPVDILQSILMLVRQLENAGPKVEIQYKRVVKPAGNSVALKLIRKVFEPADDEWRGLGVIRKSGLKLRREYSAFDAETTISVKVGKSLLPKGCICGEVLKGLKTPSECKLFAKVCTPMSPVGACMVSGEGACGVYFRHNRTND